MKVLLTLVALVAVAGYFTPQAAPVGGILKILQASGTPVIINSRGVHLRHKRGAKTIAAVGAVGGLASAVVAYKIEKKVSKTMDTAKRAADALSNPIRAVVPYKPPPQPRRW